MFCPTTGRTIHFQRMNVCLLVGTYWYWLLLKYCWNPMEYDSCLIKFLALTVVKKLSVIDNIDLIYIDFSTEPYLRKILYKWHVFVSYFILYKCITPLEFNRRLCFLFSKSIACDSYALSFLSIILFVVIIIKCIIFVQASNV